MKNAISTYEPNESGYISQAYIENDVIEGFDKVKNQVTELTNDANSIIGDIDDLVTIPEVDESIVMDDIQEDRKSTRLNSSHVAISYAVFCLKKKKKYKKHRSY